MNKQEKVGQWPLGGYIPGNEDKICGVCNKEYKGDKISAECLECGALAANEYIQIIADYNVPLNACSRSILSNKALKFPAPKPFAPIR